MLPDTRLLPQEFFDPPYYEWWSAAQNEGGGTTYQGMEESLRYLERYMLDHGPFDGLLGFSQGSTLAALIVLLQHAGIAFQV